MRLIGGLLVLVACLTTAMTVRSLPDPIELGEDSINSDPGKITFKPASPGPEEPKPPIVYGDTYIVAVPRCIRPGLSLDVYVDIVRRVRDGANVKVELINKTTNHVFASGEEFIESAFPKTISFMVPSELTYKRWNDRYYIRVRGAGPDVEFENGTDVDIVLQNSTGFLQTDKAIYKPGQRVQFRVFSLFPNLQVYKATYDIEIRDGKGNRIRNDKGLYDPSGLIKGYLNLSNEPVFGRWSITAKAQGSSMHKSFEVKEYVLPRIEVTVTPPPYIALTQAFVDIQIKAEYTFGKAVKGKLALSAKISSWYSSDRTKLQPKEEHTVEYFDGEYTFRIPMEKVKSLSEYTYSGHRLVVEANLTESLTGKTVSGKGTTTIYAHAEKVAFLQSATTCKPGLSYTVYIKVSQQDGSPIVGSKDKLFVQFNKTYYVEAPKSAEEEGSSGGKPPLVVGMIDPDSENFPLLVEEKRPAVDSIRWPRRMLRKTFEITFLEVAIPASGVVEVKLPIVPKEFENIVVNATYKKVSHVWYAYKAYSPSDSFIQMDVIKELRKPGDLQKIKLKSSKAIDSFSIMVISRGRVVMTREENKRFSTKHAFSFRITSQMAPRAKLVVYYRADNAEIVPDVVSFNVRDPFKNKVSIGFSAKEVRPGADVTMTVQADPFSLVATLVLDKKVLLLKSGNDVTEEQVTNSLWTFDSCGYYGWWGRGMVDDVIMEGGAIGISRISRRRRRRSFAPWRYPYFSMGNDASSVFSGAGLIILTDSRLYSHLYNLDKANELIPEDGGTEGLLERETATDAATEDLQEVDELRTKFPETWLFLVDFTDKDGQLNVDTQVPDSITSWRATAFAFHSESGFGISPEPGELTVVKPFFANLFMPSSVIRGEDVFIQVNVFNYLKTDQKVRVTLRGSDNFRFLDINDEGEEVLVPGPRTATIEVRENEAQSVVFSIRAEVIGDIEITATAQSSEAFDGLTKTIRVKAEGLPDEYNYAELIVLKNTSYASTSRIEYPPDVVDGSQRLSFTLVGDVLGRTVENLVNLVRMSYGCGEQNMVNFAPTVFVSQYLKAVGQLTTAKRAISVNYIDKGYQRQMRYRRSDGSFSGFGERDKEGSLWLTAFVAKSFSTAVQEGFIDIEDAIFKQAYAFIAKYQSKDGSFMNVGTVHNTKLQGQSGTGVRALTAYTLTALLENKQVADDEIFQAMIKKAVTFVEVFVETSDDLYDLAIGTYALTLAGRASAAKALTRLEEKATNEDGYTFWPVEVKPKHRWEPPRIQSQAATIETTSYVCLVYALVKEEDKGANCIAWLISQQNDYGGFVSTQDTVVAVQALSFLGPQHYSQIQAGTVTVSGGGASHTFTVDEENRLELQTAWLPVDADSVTVTASGEGTFLISISAKYNKLTNESESANPAFNLSADLVQDTQTAIIVRVCTAYIAGITSNMATLDVHLPSGFDIDGDSKDELEKIAKRVDVLNGKVVIYFDQITEKTICLSVSATSTGSVNNAKLSPAVVQDYYEPTKWEVAYYKVTSADLCNAAGCVGSCAQTCERRKKK